MFLAKLEANPFSSRSRKTYLCLLLGLVLDSGHDLPEISYIFGVGLYFIQMVLTENVLFDHRQVMFIFLISYYMAINNSI